MQDVHHLDLIERRTEGLGVLAKMGLPHALVRILEELPDVDDKGVAWPPVRVCECTGCARRFDVHDREYHAPWWEWIRQRRC